MSTTARIAWPLDTTALLAALLLSSGPLNGCAGISASGDDGKANTSEKCLYCPSGGATSMAAASPYFDLSEASKVPNPCYPPTTSVDDGGWGFSEETFTQPGTPGELSMQLRMYPVPHNPSSADIYPGYFLSAHLVMLPESIQEADEECKIDDAVDPLCERQKEAEPATYRYSGAYIAPVAFIQKTHQLPLADYQRRTCRAFNEAFKENYQSYFMAFTNPAMQGVTDKGEPYGTSSPYDAFTVASLVFPPAPTMPIPNGTCIIDADIDLDPWLTRFRWNGMMVKPTEDIEGSQPEYMVAPDGMYALWVEATSAEGETGSFAIAKFNKGAVAGAAQEVVYFKPGGPADDGMKMNESDADFGGVADLRVNWRPATGGDPCTATAGPTAEPEMPEGVVTETNMSLPDTSLPDTDDSLAGPSEEEDPEPSTGFNPFGT